MGENSSGFTNEQSLGGGTFSRDLLDQKSKSPLFPGGVGCVVTNDWCIRNNFIPSSQKLSVTGERKGIE